MKTYTSAIKDCAPTEHKLSEIERELMTCHERLCRLDDLVCELTDRLRLVSSQLEPVEEENSALPPCQSPLGCDIQSSITSRIISINKVLEKQLKLLAI